jgi:hypothetical protein
MGEFTCKQSCGDSVEHLSSNRRDIRDTVLSKRTTSLSSENPGVKRELRKEKKDLMLYWKTEMTGRLQSLAWLRRNREKTNYSRQRSNEQTCRLAPGDMKVLYLYLS